MSSTVTIEFSRDGTKAPVYIISNLSEPKWEILEMSVRENTTDGGDPIFYITFQDVKDGDYQYKFRLGHTDWWVTDPRKEEVSDGSGNTNNAISVHAPAEYSSDSSGSEGDTLEDNGIEAGDIGTPRTLADDSIFEATGTFQIPSVSRPTSASDSTAHDGSDAKEDKTEKEDADLTKVLEKVEDEKPTSAVLVPFTIVNKVPDAEAPTYGDAESETLKADTSKRAQDAEPDAEYLLTPDSSTGPDSLAESTEIPRLVVQKTDDEPSHGDDFGAQATSSQKVAHGLRAADASPDETIISPTAEQALQHPETIEAETELAPEFNHEAFECDDEPEGPILPHEDSKVLVEALEPPPTQRHVAPSGDLLLSHELSGFDDSSTRSVGTSDTVSTHPPPYDATPTPPYPMPIPDHPYEDPSFLPEFRMQHVAEPADSDREAEGVPSNEDNISHVAAGAASDAPDKNYSGRSTPNSKYVAPTVTERLTVEDPTAKGSNKNVLTQCLYLVFVAPIVSCWKHLPLLVFSVLIAAIAYYLLPAS